MNDDTWTVASRESIGVLLDTTEHRRILAYKRLVWDHRGWKSRSDVQFLPLLRFTIAIAG